MLTTHQTTNVDIATGLDCCICFVLSYHALRCTKRLQSSSCLHQISFRSGNHDFVEAWIAPLGHSWAPRNCLDLVLWASSEHENCLWKSAKISEKPELRYGTYSINDFCLKLLYLSSSCSAFFANFQRRFKYSDYAPNNIWTVGGASVVFQDRLPDFANIVVAARGNCPPSNPRI